MMKINEKIIVSISFCIILSAVTTANSACSSDNDEKTGKSTVAWSSVSGCKTESAMRKAKTNDAYPWKETVSCEARKNGQLYIKHVNAVFNCEAENLGISATVGGNRIIITEEGAGNSANCICCYDLECIIEGLDKGHYVIVFQRNGENEPRFEFALDYCDSTKGEFALSSQQ